MMSLEVLPIRRGNQRDTPRARPLAARAARADRSTGPVNGGNHGRFRGTDAGVRRVHSGPLGTRSHPQTIAMSPRQSAWGRRVRYG